MPDQGISNPEAAQGTAVARPAAEPLQATPLDQRPDRGGGEFHRFAWNAVDRQDGKITKIHYLRTGNPGRRLVEELLPRCVPGFGGLAKDQDWWIVDQFMQDPRSRNDSAFRDREAPYNLALGASATTDLFVVTASDDMHQRIEEVLRRITSDVPQVEIEATIVEISLDDDLRAGINWKLTRGSEDDPESSLIDDVSVNLAQDLMEGTFGHFSATHDDSTIQGLFEFLKKTQRTEVLSAPKLAVISGHRAVIDTGAETPFLFPTFTASAVSAISTQFKPTGITMVVTPYVLTSTMVQLEIEINVSVVTGFVTAGIGSEAEVENPLISRRGASTVFNVPEGHWALLGGMVVSGAQDSVDKVPVLGDLPLLGALFRRSTNLDRQGQVLFFVRPSIVSSGFQEAEIYEPGTAGEGGR